jgi:hypothetical protein
VLYAWLVRNLERLIEELEFHKLATQKLTVWVGYRNAQAGVSSTTFTAPTDRFDTLLEGARLCLRRAYIPRALAMRMHLFAEELRDHGPIQLELFDKPDKKAQAVATLKRNINQRYGRFVLRSGATLPLHAIYQDRANSYDICDIRGKTCF